MATLQTSGLTLKYDQRTVIEGLSADIPEGKVTMIVGANACGKSTLLRGLARLLKPAAGTVTLDGRDIHSSPAREVARTLGLLPQHPTAPDGITVRDLVGRGRYPHQGFFRARPAGGSAEDERAVQQAMAATETLELAGRNVDELSGGQRQRVWIAMALAQETEVLLLDEPTTYLDLTHQVEVLDLITDLNRQRGTTVAIVLHDLNLAARYADQISLFHMTYMTPMRRARACWLPAASVASSAPMNASASAFSAGRVMLTPQSKARPSLCSERAPTLQPRTMPRLRLPL